MSGLPYLKKITRNDVNMQVCLFLGFFCGFFTNETFSLCGRNFETFICLKDQRRDQRHSGSGITVSPPARRGFHGDEPRSAPWPWSPTVSFLAGPRPLYSSSPLLVSSGSIPQSFAPPPLFCTTVSDLFMFDIPALKFMSGKRH